MVISKWLSAAAIVAVVQGCASTGQVPPREVLGKVDGVYVEALPGVLVDQRIANPEANGPTWVNVKLRRPLEDGRTVMAARIDRGLAVERGDVVSVRLSTDNGFTTVAPAPDAVVAVLQHDDEVTPTAGDDGETRKVSWVEQLR